MPTGQVDAPESPRPDSSWAAAGVPTPSLRRRNFLDRLAKWVVSAGGVLIVAGVLGILVFILLEVLPLVWGASSTARPAVPLPSSHRVLVAGIDEHETLGYALTAAGRLEYFALDDTPAPAPLALEKAVGRTVVCAQSFDHGNELAIGASDGTVLSLSHRFEVAFQDVKGQTRPRRIVTTTTQEGDPLPMDPQGRAIVAVARQAKSENTVTVGVTADGRLLYHVVAEKKTMLGKVERKESSRDLTAEMPAAATALAIDSNLDFLYAGTRGGHLVVFTLADVLEPRRFEVARSDTGAATTVLGLLIGQRSIVAGDAQGGVHVWNDAVDPHAERGRAFKVIHDFPPSSHPVTSFAASQRDKGFATGDSSGAVILRHSTAGREVLNLKAGDGPVTWVGLSPKVTGLFGALETGKVARWTISNPHPEVGFGTYLGPVWYEGYPHPEWVWQSTGGSDDFEPKLSLVPLIIGTLKGTLFALCIAVPLSVLGALYTAQFMHPMLRGVVKPTVEIMAGLPSVVLGFIAGLWLAPTMERIVPAIFLMFVVMPLASIGAMYVYRTLPELVRHRHGEKLEILFLIPTLLVSAWVCLQLNAPVERLLFGGDFRHWALQTLGLRFEQRNSLVVGIAMGFAVIPIVFTISEDALANVPRHLSSGSLALGANRWQTAVRVVLPAALPGIFSAVMIGMGRAVGETMIVLMATGNTPTLDWFNPFSGFRTLSANIAVEIPEAAHGGTLYRTLFLGALLLFLITFVVNTAAEIVRQRMRRRYAQL